VTTQFHCFKIDFIYNDTLSFFDELRRSSPSTDAFELAVSAYFKTRLLSLFCGID